MVMFSAPLQTTVQAASDTSNYTIPGSKGKITSNAWRGGVGKSGNTGKFTYQVSAVYTGSKKVNEIKTTFRTGASLRSGASWNIGLSVGGISAGGGSNWQTISQGSYWLNTNGAKTSSWRSNTTFAPYKDFRVNTEYVTNSAHVKVSGDKKAYQISASV